MSPLGIFHTAISVLPIGFGLVAFLRDGKIDPRNRLGKLYLATMLIGSVSAFGFILSKGFTPPQVLTVITLALLGIAMFTLRGRWRAPGYAQTISLSASYLLLMVFATTETLTRVPVGNPFASGPTDPALTPIRLGLLAAFVIGVTYQVLKLRAERHPRPSRPSRQEERLDSSVSKFREMVGV
ncbi:MAG: hypothetical protein L0241_14385 [Planctomycetia bacterium]|nr:hypothetical protein [Planctomycetia bacterium]